MFKKTVLSLACAIIVCLCAVPAMAQLGGDFAALESALANEPPITQQDIDTFVKIGPDMVKAATANDQAKAAELLGQAGWSEIRGSYVTAKISNAYAISLYPDMATSMLRDAGMPEVLMPTEAELKLVQQNRATLDAVFAPVGTF